jgi:hypothetical protein
MCEPVYYIDRIEPALGHLSSEGLNGLAFGLMSAKEWLAWRERRRAGSEGGA